MNKQSGLSSWLLACRPKTLPAAIVPVAIGTALAAQSGNGILFAAVNCFAFALLVQIGTNFANDYYDFKKGADTAERIGPTRAVAAGLIRPQTMLYATMGVLLLAFFVGCGLIYYGGYWLLGVGILSVVCAVAYTGGPYPLGYNGLGDLFVILFFGLIAVGFTYYVQVGEFSADAWLSGLGCGLLINNILVVNNYRDYHTDQKAGKRTLIVRFGQRLGRWQYAASLWFGLVLIPLLLVLRGQGESLLLLLGLFPLGLILMKRLLSAESGAEYNRVLEMTAKFVILYGICFTGLLII